VTIAAFLVSHGTRLANDSYQYLSIADNLSKGHGASTNLPYFDVELAHGTIPAPVTTFPSGYSVAIAAIHSLGVSLENAAGVVTSLSVVLSVPMLAFACRLLGLGSWASRFVLFGFVANAYVVRSGLVAGTEAPFLCLVLSALVLILLMPRCESGFRFLLPLTSGLLLGLAYWVRYAGLLLIPGLFALGVARLYLERTRRAASDLALSLVGPVLLIGAGLYRNVHLTGSWKGGNTKPVYNPVLGVLKTAVRSIDDLFFGLESAHWTRLAQLVVVALLALAILPPLGRSIRRLQTEGRRVASDFGFVVLVSLTSFYMVGMTYLGVVSVISFGARMFLTVLPFLLLLLALPIAQTKSLPPKGAALVLLGCVAYLAGNAASYAGGRLAPHEVAGQSLAQPMADGTSVRSWLLRHTTEDEPVLASNGQATEYALGRPVVSLTDSEYGEQGWDEARIDATMNRFHVRYLLLYPHLERRLSAVQEESPLLAALVHGVPSSGFERVAASDGACVFERTPRR
jgi:hypothetical protein